jgi:uncharacterized membrane protein YhaH (DUF805 family)
MVRYLTLPFRLPSVLLKWLYRLSHAQKKRGRRYPYYAFPAVLALLATFAVLRGIARFWPQVNLLVDGVHVHHFAAGILILMVAGFWALCVESGRMRYILAFAQGSGMGFVLDEFYVWMNLDGSVLAHSQYDVVVYVASILVLAILMPSAADGFKRLRNGDGQ